MTVSKPGWIRLFPRHESTRSLPSEHADFLTERLLEEGDGADLRWLVTQRCEEALADWLQLYGGRRLSRRSRAFWELVLDRRAENGDRQGKEPWLL